jgi:hypothetical protein
MVYNIRKHWVSWTLYIVRYSIKNTEEHKVSEAVSRPEDANRSDFRNFAFFSVFLEYVTMYKVQNPSNSENYVPRFDSS